MVHEHFDVVHLRHANERCVDGADQLAALNLELVDHKEVLSLLIKLIVAQQAFNVLRLDDIVENETTNFSVEPGFAQQRQYKAVVVPLGEQSLLEQRRQQRVRQLLSVLRYGEIEQVNVLIDLVAGYLLIEADVLAEFLLESNQIVLNLIRILHFSRFLRDLAGQYFFEWFGNFLAEL